ncbi:MAG: hypothetical protein ACO2ZD_01610 [Pseudomonadales bacterium]
MIKAKTFLAIAQRELWEHPNLIWRIPLGLGLLFVFLAVCSVVFGFNYLSDINAEVTVDVVGGSDLMTVGDGPGQALSTFFCFAFFLLSQLIALNYLLGTLYQERKDRSILFWKSLPVSDLDVVLSKLIVGVVLVPMVYLLLAWMTSLLVALLLWLGLSSVMSDGMSFSELFFAAVYGGFEWFVIVCKQMIWGLPFFLWVLLVSGVVSSQPILWVLGIPLVVMIIENIAFPQSVISDWFWAHATPWPLGGEAQSWEPLSGASLVESVVIVLTSLILFVIAVVSRRHFNEI